MATRDMDQTYSGEFHAAAPPATFLPAFPEKSAILATLPLNHPRFAPLGKTHFLSLVDFTLENPDEIWEIDEAEDVKIYHYVSFLDQDSKIPAFVVEVVFFDDLMEVNNFTLIVRNIDACLLRLGSLVYCGNENGRKRSASGCSMRGP